MGGIFFYTFASIKHSFLQYLAQTSPEPPMYHFTDSEGIYLIDKEGKKYIDLISGIAVNNVGHRNPRVLKAIKKQLKHSMHQMVYGEYVINSQVKLAKKLASILPNQLSSVYFLNSGSEAIEGAIKLAKKFTGRKKLVAFRNAYHGSTTGALSLMDNEYYSGPFKPLLPNVHFAELNNIDSLNVIDKDTAAVIIEPIQAESGYNASEKEFLELLRAKCSEHGSLLVFDEIQSGMGRTGKMFAWEHYGIVPDIMTLAKGLGGGMPISCFISSKEIMHSLSDHPILGHITTFGGHPVSCAAGHATIKEILKKDLMADIPEKEALFRKLLQHPLISHISGKGLMLGIHLDSFERVTNVINYSYEHGLIIDWFLYNTNALRIAPPLITTKEDIEHICDILIKALDASGE